MTLCVSLFALAGLRAQDTRNAGKPSQGDQEYYEHQRNRGKNMKYQGLVGLGIGALVTTYGIVEGFADDPNAPEGEGPSYNYGAIIAGSAIMVGSLLYLGAGSGKVKQADAKLGNVYLYPAVPPARLPGKKIQQHGLTLHIPIGR
jgi:hypothetical protein